jgi:GT2 family glycosyltransferase
LLSAIVVAYGKAELLRRSLAALEQALSRVAEPTELVVVCNDPADGTAALVRRFHPQALVIEPGENLGFAGGVVAGVAATRGEWIALVNDDAVVEPDALVRLIEVGCAGDDVGSVAAQMRFADRPDTLNSAGIELDRLGVAADRLLGAPASASEDEPVEVFGASGGAALYRRAMLDDIGGFDKSFFAYLEDVDVAWRAQMRGWRTLYAPRAVVFHHHSATLGHLSPAKLELVGRNRVRLLAKNATSAQLCRYGAAMLLYDLAYVAYVALIDRTLAPLRGRATALREWRVYRRAGSATRRPVALRASPGLREALRRRTVWTRRT